MSDAVSRLNVALEGRYAIERELGEGGMATVYLAEDIKHDRKVALKVLRPELAAVVGAERFLAEIKTTANLQHPHILALFDSGEADSFLFYVMPYMEGESLRDRLDREKQLPVDEAVRIATAVANALDHAHRHNVIHRGIKPANILLQDGEAVVADFGIALAVGAAGSSRLTGTGLSLGTPHYMSPEQATGDQPVGASSDTYALGSVLYEMLVGEPPYPGTTGQAVLGKIIAGKPVSPTEQRPSIPANVDAAVRKALEKLPADRFASPQDFVRALGDEHFRHGELTAAGADVGVGPWKRVSVVTTVMLAVMSAVALWGWLRPAAEPRVDRYGLGQAPEEAMLTSGGTSLTLSPDGSRLVYVGPGDEGGGALWLKERDELRARRISGTEGALMPFFDPGGERVGFFGPDASSGQSVNAVSLESGQVITFESSLSLRRGASWGRDGIYLAGDLRHLIRLSETLGSLEPVTELGSGEAGHVYPDVLPSGRGVLFTVWHRTYEFDDADIAVVDLATGTHRVLVQGALARYAETGHLLVVRGDGVLMAAPFDEVELELMGPWVPIFSNVSVGSGNNPRAGVDLALSAGGTLAYVAGGLSASDTRELVWVERDGSVQAIDPDWTDAFESMALSPDGKRLAVAIGSTGGSDLWIKQLDRGPASLLTFTDGLNRRPRWTPDGLSVTFISDREDNRDLYVKRVDGIGSAEVVRDLAVNVDEGFWSPDGDWLIYRAGTTEAEPDIFAWRSGPDSATVPVATAPGVDEVAPTLSPDGQWLAYVSNETGRSEVWVRSFPDAETYRGLISAEGGTEPVWAHSGQELFYKSQGNLMVVSVQTGPTFEAGEVRQLFSTQGYLSFATHRGYDIAVDDQRFVMLRLQEAGDATELVVVTNFFEELKRLVPN